MALPHVFWDWTKPLAKQAGENVFVHRTDVMSADGRPVLVPGMQVMYELGTGKDGRPRAQSVKNGTFTTSRDMETAREFSPGLITCNSCVSS